MATHKSCISQVSQSIQVWMLTLIDLLQKHLTGVCTVHLTVGCNCVKSCLCNFVFITIPLLSTIPKRKLMILSLWQTTGIHNMLCSLSILVSENVNNSLKQMASRWLNHDIIRCSEWCYVLHKLSKHCCQLHKFVGKSHSFKRLRCWWSYFNYISYQEMLTARSFRATPAVLHRLLTHYSLPLKTGCTAWYVPFGGHLSHFDDEVVHSHVVA